MKLCRKHILPLFLPRVNNFIKIIPYLAHKKRRLYKPSFLLLKLCKRVALFAVLDRVAHVRELGS